jgi:Stress responsive A/B Barrel Domain
MAKLNDPKQQLVHHAIFWLKNPESIADRDKLVAGVKTLAEIPSINQINVGILANTEKRPVVDTSWAVSEIMFFDNDEAQKTYQSHHIHQEFIKNHEHLWERVIVYDALDA